MAPAVNREIPLEFNLPHVLNGVRLIEASAGGVVLEPFGSALQVSATLYPEQLGLNQPFFPGRRLAGG